MTALFKAMTFNLAVQRLLILRSIKPFNAKKPNLWFLSLPSFPPMVGESTLFLPRKRGNSLTKSEGAPYFRHVRSVAWQICLLAKDCFVSIVPSQWRTFWNSLFTWLLFLQLPTANCSLITAQLPHYKKPTPTAFQQTSQDRSVQNKSCYCPFYGKEFIASKTSIGYHHISSYGQTVHNLAIAQFLLSCPILVWTHHLPIIW